MIVKRKALWGAVFGAVLLYCGVMAFLYVTQRGMIYLPDAARPAPAAGVEVARVQTEDGLPLEGWYIAPRKTKSGNARPVILLFHGNARNLADRFFKAEAYSREGYGVLLAEYRGYGGNPGAPGEEGLYRDARAFIGWLAAEKGVPPENIILYGESLGTGVAVQMASEYPAAGLVLEAPYTSLVDVARKRYFMFPLKALMKDQYRSVDKIGAVRMPVLILHGDGDAVVPFALGEALYGAAREPKTFVRFPGGGHNDLYDRGAALHVLNFLRSIESQSNGG